ncbi:TldD/PmbA family protein [bacterium]|nr:TldD/PmbA family protein [candidate division CSSED10-310 bacterium]
MERIVELASKEADSAEVFRIERSQIPVVFKHGKVATVEQDESVGTTLRVIKNGRIGFSATTKPDDARGLVDRAVAAAAVGPRGELAFPGLEKNFGKGQFYDKDAAALTPKKMISIGKEMFDIIRTGVPELETSGDVSRTIEKITVMNSNGGNVSYSRTAFQVFIYGLLVQEGGRAELEHTYACTNLAGDPLEMARMAVWRFNNCKRTVPMPTRYMPVIFTSLAFRGLYVPLFVGLNGLNVFRKTSRLADMIGESIADERFTLADDPTMPCLTASGPVDDEGTLTSRRELIAGGVLQGYFYDLQTAARAGVASTGNGYKKGSLYEPFRLDVPPACWPSSFVVTPGEVSIEEMIGGIDEGLIVDDVIGAGQGNSLNGEFAMSVSLGYKIENGEISGRVKDVMVAGNVYEMLKRIRHIGDKPVYEDTLFGRYYAPWMCFDDVSVASS